MILVQELLKTVATVNGQRRSNGPFRQYAFDANGNSLDPDIHTLACFLIGCRMGSLILRLYAWILDQIYGYAGDSNVLLALVCIMARTGLESDVSPIMMPTVKEGTVVSQCFLLWLSYSMLLSSAMRYPGWAADNYECTGLLSPWATTMMQTCASI